MRLDSFARSLRPAALFLPPLSKNLLWELVALLAALSAELSVVVPFPQPANTTVAANANAINFFIFYFPLYLNDFMIIFLK